MSYFYTSGLFNESFDRTLSLMRGNWERGLCTTLFTPEYSPIFQIPSDWFTG